MRVKPSIAAKNREQVDVLIAGFHLERDAGGAVALEDEPPVAEDPVDEIDRRRVQDDDLDRAPQQPLQLSLQSQIQRAEGGGQAPE